MLFDMVVISHFLLLIIWSVTGQIEVRCSCKIPDFEDLVWKTKANVSLIMF